MFKNHKWPRLSCVHYTKWHFVLKCTGTVVWGQPTDHSPSQSHKQLDGGRAAPLPTPLQARPFSFLASLLRSFLWPSAFVLPVLSQHSCATDVHPIFISHTHSYSPNLTFICVLLVELLIFVLTFFFPFSSHLPPLF